VIPQALQKSTVSKKFNPPLAQLGFRDEGLRHVELLSKVGLIQSGLCEHRAESPITWRIIHHRRTSEQSDKNPEQWAAKAPK
jgi:hypothetical protein